ncbi:MAG: PQQ-binding-like beta-propeller repeat protein, partial [Lentisphaerae bacterium]|nr:PQQ-binding-like beta-propeller repeat protein [Lentisphaerota bacterium]
MIRRRGLLLASLSLALIAVGGSAQEHTSTPRQRADAVFKATGVTGGLVVHLGCGDGCLTAALKQDGISLVHGLEADREAVAKARVHIRSLGIYGQVAVEHWDASVLPFADHTVNLLVVEAPGSVPPDEMTRVLVPGGVSCVKKGDTWATTTKPPRAGVDDWTHFLHSASGNPVSSDTVMGPPRHLQWTAEPRHTRSHEFTPSIQAVVSAAGRLFYIADTAPTDTLRKPAEWAVVARDAYNGLLLWEQPIPEWFSHLCGWTSGPQQLQRKLVAVKDRVYVTLGFHDQVRALDAATGKTLLTYADTHGTDEILYHNGILLLAVREVTEERLAEYRKWADLTTQSESPLHVRDSARPLVKAFRKAEGRAPRTIVALNATTGQLVWKKMGAATAGLRPFSLRACGSRVYCQTNSGLHCFDVKTGGKLWTTSTPKLRAVSENAVVCL